MSFLGCRIFLAALFSTTFPSVETPVSVVGNVNIGLDKKFTGLEYKPNVFDIHASFEPLLFIECFYFEYVVGNPRMVEVIGGDFYGKAVGFDHFAGIGVHEGAIAFQVDNSTGRQDVPIELHKAGGSEALAHFLHLWVGEGYPYLGDFAGPEKMVY